MVTNDFPSLPLPAPPAPSEEAASRRLSQASSAASHPAYHRRPVIRALPAGGGGAPSQTPYHPETRSGSESLRVWPGFKGRRPGFPSGSLPSLPGLRLLRSGHRSVLVSAPGAAGGRSRLLQGGCLGSGLSRSAPGKDLAPSRCLSSRSAGRAKLGTEPPPSPLGDTGKRETEQNPAHHSGAGQVKPVLSVLME